MGKYTSIGFFGGLIFVVSSYFLPYGDYVNGYLGGYFAKGMLNLSVDIKTASLIGCAMFVLILTVLGFIVDRFH